jgi:uncharacterized caspase-like protein
MNWLARFFVWNVLQVSLAVVALALVGLPTATGATLDRAGPTRPTLHFIVFSNGEYEKVTKLPGAQADFDMARKMFSLLKGNESFAATVYARSSKKDFKTPKEFWQKLQNIEKDFKPGDAVVFYYSGHGASYDGADYLIPLGFDPSIATSQNLPLVAVQTSRIAGMLGRKTHGFVLLLLDACRKDFSFPVADPNKPGSKAEAKVTSQGLAAVLEDDPLAIDFPPISARVYALDNNKVAPAESLLTRALSAVLKELASSSKNINYADLTKNMRPTLFNLSMDMNITPPVYWDDGSGGIADMAFWPIDAEYWSNATTSWNSIVASPTRKAVSSFVLQYPFSQYSQAAYNFLAGYYQVGGAKTVTADGSPIAKVDELGNTSVNPAAIDQAYEVASRDPVADNLAAIVVSRFPIRYPRVLTDQQTAGLQSLGANGLGIVVAAAETELNSKAEALVVSQSGEGTMFARQIEKGGVVVLGRERNIALNDFTFAQNSIPIDAYSVNIGDTIFKPETGRIVASVKPFPLGSNTFPQGQFTFDFPPPRYDADSTLSIPRDDQSTSNLAQTIGRPMFELNLPALSSAKALVEEREIFLALDRLKGRNRTISWVSIATGKLASPSQVPASRASSLEDAQRQLRVLQIKKIFTDRGIDSKYITVVNGAAGLLPELTRIRVFGF